MSDEKRSQREKAIQAALAQIEKSFGKGSVVRMDQEGAIADVQAISTGSLGVDLATGIGGFPRGRISEIYGPESSGKTTLALSAIAQAHRDPSAYAAFVDVEHALDPTWAEALGVDMSRLYLSQPDTGEEALAIVDKLTRSHGIDLTVVDSVSALTPKAEIEGEIGDTTVGLQARLMSSALRNLRGAVRQSNMALLFINQIRMKIGVMPGTNPETTSGGNALKFYASMRMDIRRIGQVKEGDEVIGNKTKVKVVKNKLSAPFRIATFNLLYEGGISRIGELLELAVEAGVVGKSGSWFSYKGSQLGQGVHNTVASLQDEPEILDAIEQETKEALGLDFESNSTVVDESAVEAGSTDGQDGGSKETVPA